MWRCEKCGEQHEQVFEACWNCSSPRPSPAGDTINHAAGCSCERCGEALKDEDVAFGFPVPDYFWSIPEGEREESAILSADQCVLNDSEFFVAGNLILPVVGMPEGIIITCWVSLSESEFNRMSRSWEQVGRERDKPYCGWFSNQIPGYPDTLQIKALLRNRAVGQRPIIELEPTDHPLSRDFHEGLPDTRAGALRQTLLLRTRL